MRNIIGVNIQGDQGENEDYIAEVVDLLNPHAIVVINNRKLATRLMPKTDRLIYRVKTDQWNDDDADHYNARAFAQMMIREAPDGAYLHGGNEQGATQHLADWTDVFMDELESKNRLGCILNMSVGYPPNIRELDKFAKNYRRAATKGHLLGSHDGYFNRRWDSQFIDRHIYLRDVLMKGEPFPEIVMTECGCVYDYQPHRGYRWGDGALTDGQYARELIDLAKHYRPHGISMCVFVLSRDYERNEWRHFIPRDGVYDVVGQEPVQWEAYKMAYVKPPTTGGVFARLTKIPATTTFVNMRDQPDAKAADIGDARIGDEGMYYPANVTNGWVYFEGNGKAGWVSLQGGNVAFTPVVNEPKPPDGITITREQFAEWKALHAQLGELIKEVEPSNGSSNF